MLRPKQVGWLILLYVLLSNPQSLFNLGMLLYAILAEPWSLFNFITTGSNLIYVFDGFLVLCYVAGGIGLILRRHWGNLIVLLSAIIELVVTLIIMLKGLIMKAIGRHEMTGDLSILGFSQSLLYLVFPAAIVYAAYWLRKHDDAWLPSLDLEVHREEMGSSDRHIQQIKWIIRLFWTLIGTGLVLPSIVGMIVREILKTKGTPVVSLNEGVEWLILVTPFFAAPFVILAMLSRSVLKYSLYKDPTKFIKKCFIFIGSFIGTFLLVVVSMFGFFHHIENIQVLIFTPLYPFYLAFPGAVAGALVSWVVFHLRQRIRKKISV